MSKQSLLKIVLMASVLVVVTITAYLPAMKAGFIWDDDLYVTNNSSLTAPHGLYRIWFTMNDCPQYVPFVYTTICTTFWVEHQLWGFDPMGYHVVNVMIHITNALLLWLVLRRLSIPGAWFASAVFALHPVQVESVAWITELKNTMMVFFSLLTILCWMEFTVFKRSGRRAYVGSLLLYALSLSSKSTACTLPAAFVLILWLKRVPLTAKRWLQIVPFVAMGIGTGFLVMWREQRLGTGLLNLRFGSAEKLLIAGRALWFYLWKLFWPVNLTFSYPYWHIDPTVIWQYAGPSAFVILIVCMWLLRKRMGRAPLVALLFFVLTLVPMLGFFSLYTFLYTFVADHYQYAACIGPISLISAVGCCAASRLGRPGKGAATITVVCVLGLLGLLTWRQCHIYKDMETLWRDTLKKNPDSSMAHNNLATELRAQGKFDESVSHSREAVRLAPDNIEGLCNLAAGLQIQGKLDEAIECYRRVVQNMNEYGSTTLYADAYNGLGSVLLQQGKLEESYICFKKALTLNPDNLFAWLNLSTIYAEQGKFKEALEHIDKAIQIDPGSTEAQELKKDILRRLQKENH